MASFSLVGLGLPKPIAVPIWAEKVFLVAEVSCFL
jgi:hypothetical protein